MGLTRAQRKLYLTHAEQRRLHGRYRFTTPSRFIREIPRNLLQELGQRMSVSRPVYRRERYGERFAGRYDAPSREPFGGDDATMRLGQRVRHGRFGEGVVLAWEGSGSHARVQVNFETAGTKWLVLAYAKLELM